MLLILLTLQDPLVNIYKRNRYEVLNISKIYFSDVPIISKINILLVEFL